MRQVNIHHAKTHLSKLIDEAVHGESFVIAKAGKPLVQVTAIESQSAQPQRLGFLKGQFSVSDDFDTLCQEEIIAMFEGTFDDDPMTGEN